MLKEALMHVFTSKRSQISKQFSKPTQILFFLSPQPKEWFPNVIKDFESCGYGLGLVMSQATRARLGLSS